MFIPSVTLCLAGVLQGQATTLDNLNFEKGNLSGWQGKGFYVTGADPRGPSPRFAVSSSDAASPSHRGTLRRDIVIPPRTASLRCSAYATYGLGYEADADRPLNIVLLRGDEQEVPRKVRRGSQWISERRLLPPLERQPREYLWDVADLVGQTVTIVLTDEDERRGCHVFCTGLRLVSQIESAPNTYADFVAHMLKLQKTHNLARPSRYDSKRFLALSTAGETFTTQRLRYCESFYDLFCGHFQKAGFATQPPADKLMVAVFDAHDGFEAYLGQKMPLGVTGVYMRDGNRLVLYDLRGDPALLASKDRALAKSQALGSSLDRKRVGGTIERQFDDLARDINLSTTMHEAAHQLSFNVGLLNRQGDVALWLAEGLACYCEATNEGDWQALGAVNPGRVDSMREAVRQNKLMPLAEMIRSDGWLQSHALLGYGQSWALFRMLMHERPKALRNYLALIYSRRTPDHRMTDFQEAFGDVNALESRYRQYLRELAQTVAPQKLR